MDKDIDIEVGDLFVITRKGRQGLSQTALLGLAGRGGGRSVSINAPITINGTNMDERKLAKVLRREIVNTLQEAMA